MTAVDESALVASRLPEEDVEVPGVGTVRVRSLSRAEVMDAKTTPRTPVEEEVHLLSCAVVAPKLTKEAVARWQAASGPDEIEAVVAAIVRLSGLNEKATAKEAVTQFRD